MWSCIKIQEWREPSSLAQHGCQGARSKTKELDEKLDHVQTLRFLAGLLIGMYSERNDIIGASKIENKLSEMSMCEMYYST
jgi:hypothetical protein